MAIFIFAALLVAAPAFAQQEAPQPQPEGTEGSSKNNAACQQAQANNPPSKPVTGTDSGTASSNSGGSSGWSGSGLGGSNTGTTPGASISREEQPAVATGVDLGGTSAKAPQTAQNKC